jgi:hypothetical protein
MQCLLYKIYFWKGFSYALEIDMHHIYAPMLTKFYSCKKWVLHAPTEVSLEVLATTKQPRAPSCALWVLATTKPAHLQPDGLSSNIIRTTDWHAKTSLYHILSQAVPIYHHGCTVFMGGRCMN